MESAIKNKNSERIVVGILLNNPHWILETSGLKYRHFFDRTHKTIFYLLTLLTREQVETIDTMAILARAEKLKEATDVINSSGGYEYIESLRILMKDYSVSDLKHHTDEIMLNAYKRDQIEQKEEFINLIKSNQALSYSDINLWLQESQTKLQSEYANSGEIHLIGEVFDETWKEIEDMRGEHGVVGLPSKIDIVNKYFTYIKGELIVIGARAKYGKSNFGINEAHWLSVILGIPVAYLDSEMKTRTFLTRILSIDSGVPLKMIMDGTYENDPAYKVAVEMSKERIKKAPLIHKYSYNWDKSNVRETALLLKARYGLGILIYDYIKVKEVSGAVKEHNELGNWTIFLKDLAGELDLPILTFAQLSPHEVRLADSDKINRYASTIAYLLPKEGKEIARDGGVSNGGSDFMYIDYNRNGASMSDPTKGINLYYTRHNVTFEQAPFQILEDDFM